MIPLSELWFFFFVAEARAARYGKTPGFMAGDGLPQAFAWPSEGNKTAERERESEIERIQSSILLETILNKEKGKT